MYEAAEADKYVVEYLNKYNFTKVLFRNLENLIIARG